MNPVLKKIIFAGILVAVAAAGFWYPWQVGMQPRESIAVIPIQHEGRIKPLDIFSTEVLSFISGKTQWKEQSAREFILNVFVQPTTVVNIPFILLDYDGLKEYLGLPVDRKYFSYQELQSSLPQLVELVRATKKKRDQDLRPTFLEQKGEMLYSRMMTVAALSTGEMVTVIPSAAGVWSSPGLSYEPLADDFMPLVRLYQSGDENNLSAALEAWRDKISTHSTEVRWNILNFEVYYHRLRPFLLAWILYAAGFVVLSLAQRRTPGLFLLLLGFVFHSAGLLLRSWILWRPPVSNMYETMIFMNWIIMICAFIFFAVRRQDFFLSTAAVVSALVMIYADLLPIERSLGVLVPVLRSNYWLTIHVLTIVSSYGIFGLAMALGHRQLFLRRLKKLSPEGQVASEQVIMRLLQIGVITLGAGTVLGGIWANESWGRFWGWDPKETWALITFLGYLAVVHLRYAGKLTAAGLAVSAILGFLLVVMTWYGVNFILGRGLHSYGSGSGGAIWVVYYLVFEVLFLGFVFLRKK